MAAQHDTGQRLSETRSDRVFSDDDIAYLRPFVRTALGRAGPSVALQADQVPMQNTFTVGELVELFGLPDWKLRRKIRDLQLGERQLGTQAQPVLLSREDVMRLLEAYQ